jgi:hypothetical protein
MPNYLVVAHQTADSDELIAAVRELVDREPDAEFWLVVPATPVEHLFIWTEGEARKVAEERAHVARSAIDAIGAHVVDAVVGDADPVLAVKDFMLTQAFDAIVIATLPPGISRWIRMDVIHRLQREVDVPILHVPTESKGA